MATIMASNDRPKSFLPTIKCSDCNAEIQISMMGDHICERAPESNSSRRGLNGPFAASTSDTRNGPQLLKSSRMPPPSIDAAAANRSFIPPAQLTPRSISSNPRSASPITPGSDRRSPYRLPSRSATAPLPYQPPSPEILSQDCAFPPFPTSKPIGATPITPLEVTHPPHTEVRSSQVKTESAQTYAPMSPRRNGGGRVLQRMNTITPGPFNVGGKSNEQDPGHKRTATLGSSKDYIRPQGIAAGKPSLHRSSTADSGKPQNPPLSSQGLSNLPSFKPGTAPSRPSRPDDLSDSTPIRPISEKVIRAETIHQETRSQTFPLDKGHHSSIEGPTIPLPRRPSESSPPLRSARPAISAINRPLHEIGSTSSYKPRHTASQSKIEITPMLQDSSKSDELKKESRVDVSRATKRPEKSGAGNSHHTSTESNSSNESSSSEAKSGSSRSSPPLSAEFPSLERRPSDNNRIDYLKKDIQPVMQNVLTNHTPLPSQRGSPLSFSRPMYTKPMDPPVRPQPSIKIPDSRANTGYPTPASLPANQTKSTSSQPANSYTSPMSPPSTSAIPARKATTGNKGKCRGCGELIIGKSVSSADGRLTGRYHKLCFVCKTCKEAFQTADFYVMDNHPYCERHYHELNDSLCKSCDRGIEGQYLETEMKQKFHSHCFTCYDCRKILNEDYFEMNRKIYCETHAFRAAQQSSFLGGPGRKHPERRTTRLMMM